MSAVCQDEVHLLLCGISMFSLLQLQRTHKQLLRNCPIWLCRFVVLNLPNLGGIPNLSPPFLPRGMARLATVSHSVNHDLCLHPCDILYENMSRCCGAAAQSYKCTVDRQAQSFLWLKRLFSICFHCVLGQMHALWRLACVRPQLQTLSNLGAITVIVNMKDTWSLLETK